MQGVLLINLGTPDSPSVSDVRRYLAQFLWDGRVIDLHPIPRFLLLHGVILRVRPRKSAHAYRRIWDPRTGSPLLAHSLALRDAVRRELGQVPVELGMRYGNPSIAAALGALREQGVDELVVLPLYPQYASASTGSSLEELARLTAKAAHVPALQTIPAFFADEGFLAASAARLRRVVAEQEPTHVLFSYHGLPLRQVRAAATDSCMTFNTCCDSLRRDNAHCYRAQCLATTRALAAHLPRGVSHSTAFQSRLKGTPWIQPFTDEVILELARAGHKRVAVACPSFVADCLETLEEIGMRLRESFLEAGGEALTLVPSLNAEPDWVEAVASLVRSRLRPETRKPLQVLA